MHLYGNVHFANVCKEEATRTKTSQKGIALRADVHCQLSIDFTSLAREALNIGGSYRLLPFMYLVETKIESLEREEANGQ